MTRLAAENPKIDMDHDHTRAQVAAFAGIAEREQALGAARVGLYDLARLLGVPAIIAGPLASKFVDLFTEATAQELRAPGVDVEGVRVER